MQDGRAVTCSTECLAKLRSKERIPLFDRWTRRSAYIFGLLASDGHIGDTGAISFTSVDEDLSRFVASSLGPRASVGESLTPKGTHVFKVHLWSRSTVDRLIDLGLIPRKSKTLKWPIIPARLLWDFLRGILDGDGHIDKARRISWSSASPDFVDGLIAVLRAYGFMPHHRPRKGAAEVYLSVGDSRRLGELLYRRGFCFALSRKRLKLTPSFRRFSSTNSVMLPSATA